MANKTRAEKLDEFLSLKTHSERCDYMEANPELGPIFGTANHAKKKEPIDQHSPITPNSK